MLLTERDRQILELLRNQGFASFDQLNKRFFNNTTKTSSRLNLLIKENYLTSYNIKDYLKDPNSSFYPYVMSLGLSPRMKIYLLNNHYKKQFNETNRLIKKDLLLHQLLLNDVYFYLKDEVFNEMNEKNKTHLLLNDPEHKILSSVDITKRKEFTPDLTYISGKMCISIELERTAKNQNRYQQRFWFYEDSSFTHVIYYYVNESHLPNLLKFSGLNHKFAFAHYSNPGKLFSNLYGYMGIHEWIEKINQIEGL